MFGAVVQASLLLRCVGQRGGPCTLRRIDVNVSKILSVGSPTGHTDQQSHSEPPRSVKAIAPGSHSGSLSPATFAIRPHYS